jgi:hypothetical protein
MVIFAITINPSLTNMYDQKPKKDWASAAVTAALGAGVVTTFAVSQGQHPLMALGITAFAVAAALVVDHYA